MVKATTPMKLPRAPLWQVSVEWNTSDIRFPCFSRWRKTIWLNCLLQALGDGVDIFSIRNEVDDAAIGIYEVKD